MLFIIVIFLFTPKITELLLKVEIKGNSVEGVINDFINNNETFNNICNGIPGARRLVEVYPTSLISLFHC